MEDRVENLIMLERAEPKKRILASTGALYAALLIGVILVIVLGNDISARFHWPRIIVQLLLYGLLAALGYLIYRFRLTSFRYTLTERMLRIDRIVGVREVSQQRVRLADIRSIRRVSKHSPAAGGRVSRLYIGRKRDALALSYRADGGAGTLLLSPSEEFCDQLVQAWKKCDRSE